MKRPEDDEEVTAEEEADWRFFEERRATEKEFEKTLSQNPIISTVQRALRERGVRVSMEVRESGPAAAEDFIIHTFGAETSQSLGRMLLRALLDGDRDFSKVVSEAIKKIDPVFNRNRELAIAPKVKKYVWSLPGPLPQNRELRGLVESHCNNGRPFSDDQWLKLRKACLLPVSKRGRPKTSTKPVE